MGFSGRALMSLSMALLSAGVVITALKWPFKTALFPVITGISVFLLAGVDFLQNLSAREKTRKGESTMDFKLSEDVDQSLAIRRTLLTSAWILGFFLTILFLGFSIAVPLMVFLYLKVQGKESWRLCLMLTGVAWVSFYGLFVWLLDIPFPEGWFFRALRALGLG